MRDTGPNVQEILLRGVDLVVVVAESMRVGCLLIPLLLCSAGLR
jgi:hypothetical protein